jgi:DNA topoisomerase-1
MPPKSKKTQTSDNYLLIVESPSKCAKIESYLGERYKCISSKGHIREIDGLSSINTKDKFQIEYTIIPEKKDHVEILKKTVAKYPPLNILLATDDDREGEAIAWHICQVCGLDPVVTKRIVFHEITQPALLNAVANPTVINLSLVAAQQARQVLDIIVGFKISPLLWRSLGGNKKNALSAGRCQTPALRLVFDHHQKYGEARATGVTSLYKIAGIFTNRQIKFDLDADITSQECLQEFLEKSKTHEHRMMVGKTRASFRSPPKPFNTSRLLQIASSQYHLSPKQTMNLCQTLYQSGLITYMRTECQKYSDVFLQKCKDYIHAEYGEVYIGDFSSIVLNDTTMPHEGIRVTNLALSSMTSNDAALSRLYGLIWRNTVESCMSVAKYNMTDYSIDCPPLNILDANAKSTDANVNAKYKYTMETPIFLGWRRVEMKDASLLTEVQTVESSLALYLEQIAKSSVPVTWTIIESKVAVANKLPSHYTEASLIQKLEDLGIGRPSTFSSIVETIQERGYVKKTNIVGIKQICIEYKLRSSINATSQHILEKTELEKSFGDERDKLVIQPTGILVLEFLLKHFEDTFSYDYTKSMEDELDLLSSQHSDKTLTMWYQICKKCFDDITERSKPLAKQAKQTFALADTADYVLIFNTYGASIKSSNRGTQDARGEGETKYMKIRPDIELDLEKAKRCEYTMSELVWREDNGCLGEYNGCPVYVKKGKFGLYAEYGKLSDKEKSTISLKPLHESANNILLEDVIDLIQKKNSVMSREDATEMFLPQSLNMDGLDGEYKNEFMDATGYGHAAKSNVGASSPMVSSGDNKTSDKTLLRALRTDLSIRKGKYGPYIFHKTSQMTKPSFHPIKPFKDRWESMDNLELIAAIENTYRLSI